MKNLIITEKPSVGRQFADALHVYDKHEGYIENERWVITWALGHLVELAYPEKYDEKYRKWNLNDLPFIPSEWKYQIIKSSSEQFKIVKNLLNRSDIHTIYNAGDSGREGELIQRLIFEQADIIGTKSIKRIWIDSQTDAEIIRGIREAKPSCFYDNLATAAKDRSFADYLVGINLSRALSCKFGYEFNKSIDSKKYVPISVGRVMTCVLGMIVEREEVIKNFTPTDFYKIDAVHDEHGFKSHWKAVDGTKYFNSPLLYNISGLKNEADASELINNLNTDPFLSVADINTQKELKNPPLLFNLAELQAECSKRYKISPDETLAVAQKLYESKLTTYPRTDARVLSTAVSAEIKTNLDGIKDILPEMSVFIDAIYKLKSHEKIAKTKYCDNSKITDHYAIIPTGEGNISGLTDLQKSIYDLITRRFISIFCPPAEYEKTEISLKHSTGERFFSGSKILKKKGFLAVTGMDANNESEEKEPNISLASLTTGQKIHAAFELIASKTQPPKRYSSGSMILAMENAGKLIEDEELRSQIKGSGIGTSATRAETIKKLIGNEYITLTKKTQILTPTKIGESLVGIIRENLPELLNPKMTASWEKGLSQVETGIITGEKFMDVFNNFIIKHVNSIKQKEAEQAPEIKHEVKGICPVCGKDVITTRFGLLCTGYKKDDDESCHFGIPYEFGGVRLTEEDINTLLTGKTTNVLHGLQPKDPKKKPYDAALTVRNGRVVLDLPEEETMPTNLICPSCKSPLRKGKYSYKCLDHKCGFKVFHTMSGHEINEHEAESLFKDRVIGPVSDFENKNGEAFDAYLIFDKKSFILVKTTLSGRTFEFEEIKTLALKKKLPTIDGFIGKKGAFSAGIRIKDGKIAFAFEKKKKCS